MTSISTRASRGRRAAWTVDRAGYGSLKNVAYTSFIAWKSFMSARNTVLRTTCGKGQAGGLEQRADVFEDPPRVHGDIALDHPAGRGIERHLTRYEQQLARAQRRRIRTDRLRRERAGNRLLQAALVTLPERRQRVQTRMRLTPPLIIALTV